MRLHLIPIVVLLHRRSIFYVFDYGTFCLSVLLSSVLTRLIQVINLSWDGKLQHLDASLSVIFLSKIAFLDYLQTSLLVRFLFFNSLSSSNSSVWNETRKEPWAILLAFQWTVLAFCSKRLHRDWKKQKIYKFAHTTYCRTHCKTSWSLAVWSAWVSLKLDWWF